ncbi:MAG: APC family permease [Actinomycetota bacterium]|nr:APC family permease [Actinomycetota bacterium]
MHVVAQALAVGPIYSAGLLLFLVARTAGAATPFVVLVAMLGSLALAWAISLYARRYFGAGAVYEYVRRAHSPVLGSLFGVTYFIVYLAAVGVLLLLAGLLTKGFALSHLGLDPPWWGGGIAAGVFVFAVAYLGITLSARTQLALTALAAVPLLALVVVVIVRSGTAGNTLSVFNPRTEGAGNVFRGLLFGVQLFVGFEAAASLGEETRDPQRIIPRAMLATVALAGVFYLAVAYVGTIGFGLDSVAEEWGGNPLGLSELAGRFMGGPFGALVELAIVVDVLAVLAAIVNTVARGVFAMARDNVLPARLAAVSRHSTPIGGLLVAAGAATLGLIVPNFVEPTRLLETFAVTTLLCVLLVYVVLAAGAVRLCASAPGSRARWLALTLAIAVPVAGIAGTVTPLPAGPPLVGTWLAIGLLVASGLWAATTHRRLAMSQTDVDRGRNRCGP